ncbi:hypothetical protein ACFVHB_20225 [Kitasatospora sp. NPDC127111]|uniref:hypothetical protein n=1 Tax=Kitasatospora sp. NPDC127111 TaxID=3345363 RepID=UPI00363AAC02
MDSKFDVGDEVRYNGPRWKCIGTIKRISDDGSRLQVVDAAGAIYCAKLDELTKYPD